MVVECSSLTSGKRIVCRAAGKRGETTTMKRRVKVCVWVCEDGWFEGLLEAARLAWPQTPNWDHPPIYGPTRGKVSQNCNLIWPRCHSTNEG